MIEKKSFLGTGWSFPPEFTKNPCRVAMVSDDEDIKQSLKIWKVIHQNLEKNIIVED